MDRNANSWVWNRRAAATAVVNLPQGLEANAAENKDDEMKGEDTGDAKEEGNARVPDDEFDEMQPNHKNVQAKENRVPNHGAPPVEGEAEAKKQWTLCANAIL